MPTVINKSNKQNTANDDDVHVGGKAAVSNKKVTKGKINFWYLMWDYIKLNKILAEEI